MKIILYLPVILSLFFTLSFAQSGNKKNTLPGTVADSYGLKSWPAVTSISFTFNVKAGEINVKRSWKWEPGSGLVEYSGPGENGKDTVISYNRNNLDKKQEFIISVDKKFINDSYWLLFPFHLVWDNNVDIKDEGISDSPITHSKDRTLVVQYINNVGYTPNDEFVLYLNKNNMIKEWIYRPGGSKEKERAYTWEGNKNFNGITISTEHNGPNKKTKVWFTGIEVETNHRDK